MKNLFVDVTGQMDNIGDSLLRRGMLDSVRQPEIQMHIHVGGSTDGYISGLSVHESDILYRTRTEWIDALKVDRGRGETSFLANAGETMRLRGPRHLGPRLHVGLLAARRRGGALLHTGVGIRDLASSPRIARLNVLRFFDLVTWRDASSRDYAGIGGVQPDWGFATGANEVLSTTPRDTLAVSVRGDRDPASGEWVATVRAVADALGCRIVTFSQVTRDSSEAEALAERLGAADCVLWPSNAHDEQEERIRALFRRSVGVVSDRVHALIVGATEGAYPLGLPPVPNEKSQRTLNIVRFPHHLPTIDDAAKLISHTTPAELNREVADAVAAARRDLTSRAHQIVQEVLDR